jgi:hypothetical protein
LGAVALMVALQRSSGMYDFPALLLATFAAACALLAIGAGRSTAGEEPIAPQVILGAGLAYGLYCHWALEPGFYARPKLLGGFHALAGFAVIPASSYVFVHLRASLQRARFWLLLAIFALMGAAMLRASPHPYIDVHVFRQVGGTALANGKNPYSIAYPNLYRSEQWYAPQALRGGNVVAYPYLPLTPMLDALPRRLGLDARWVTLACMVIAAWAIAALGGGAVGELAALALLFQGRTFFVLEQAWTEPLVLAAFTVALLLASRPAKRWPQWIGLGLSFGLLAATKQYSPLLILPLWMVIPTSARLKASLLALGVAAATIVPFALWDWQGFLRGAVYLQFWQPLRTDALSWAAFAARGGAQWSVVVAFAAAAVALAAGVRWRMDAARATATAAAAWLLLVSFNKQAFCNYDWLGTGLLCAAAAAFAARKWLQRSGGERGTSAPVVTPPARSGAVTPAAPESACS